MESTTAVRKYYSEIDVARGFVLFLTVFAHTLTGHTFWFNWVSSFIMQAFFFLSGMTFNPDKFDGFGHFLKVKIKKRVIPYFAICLVGLIICLLRPDYRAPLFEAGWSYELTWLLYYAQPRNLYIGQVWFLAGLFMTEVFFYLWFRVFGKTHPLVRFYSVVVIAWLGVKINVINQFFPTMGRLPWKMDMAVGALVFMIAGYYVHRSGILYNMVRYYLYAMPLLVGLDGVQKMSKSKKNYIGITDPANDMFGKVMSITDDLMWNWYDLLSLRSNAEIAQLKKECAEGRNPRDAKVLLAREIIERFHDKAAADAAEAEFNARFQKGAVPNDIKDVTVAAPTGEIGIMQLIKAAGLAPSNAEAGRNIDQGGVRIDGETVRDRTLKIQAGAEFVLQVGKRRWARVKVTAQ